MAGQGINRRKMLSMSACAGAGLVVLGNLSIGCSAQEGRKSKAAVSASEGLTQEHGVLIRLLLVSREAIRRLDAGDGAAATILRQAAEVIEGFVGEGHERIEEMRVFPKFEGSGALPDLVRVLNDQHEAGRAMTKRILQLARTDAMNPGEIEEARRLVESFERMYYPHLAWEDSVLFPAFRASMAEAEYGRMGEQFEQDERELLGEDGEKKALATLADLEKELGLSDLSRFTSTA
uniref:Hemerythrin-like domain-containing protein n=1 Tax=Desulfovibrio sp. U5L TaxID=596152 RepID=I2Q1A7_9BACT